MSLLAGDIEMAIVAHLVERIQEDGQNNIRDSIRAMVVAIDDAVDTTAALIQARGVTIANAQGHDLPTGYFTSNTAMSTFDAAGDHAIFTDKLSQVIA